MVADESPPYLRVLPYGAAFDPSEVFVSYSHVDEELRQELEAHLAARERQRHEDQKRAEYGEEARRSVGAQVEQIVEANRADAQWSAIRELRELMHDPMMIYLPDVAEAYERVEIAEVRGQVTWERWMSVLKEHPDLTDPLRTALHELAMLAMEAGEVMPLHAAWERFGQRTSRGASVDTTSRALHEAIDDGGVRAAWDECLQASIEGRGERQKMLQTVTKTVRARDVT